MARKKAVLDRREGIMQASERLFNYFGYEKTTMEDISRASGIPRATVYLEFPGGKEDILMANIGQTISRTIAEMQRMARTSKNGRLETLKQAILFNILSAYDKTTQHFDPNNIEKYCKRVRVEMADLFNARKAFFREMLQQAALAGEIADGLDYEHLAGLLERGLLCWMPAITLESSRQEVEQDASVFFSLLLNGLAKTHRRRLL